jgi:hypothetical protein
MALEEETTLEELEASERNESTLFGGEDTDADIEVIVDDIEDPVEELAPPTIPEPEPTDTSVTDADMEAGDQAYPESIKKRIKREIRIRKKAQDDGEQIRAAAVQAVQYAQAKEAELVTAKEQVRNLQKQHADVLDLAFDKDIQLKRLALKSAREEGRNDDEMVIQGEMNTLQYQQNQIRDVKRTLANTVEPLATQQQQPAPQPTAQPQREPPAPLAVAWIDRNKIWFNNPEYAGHKHFVLGVDAQLIKEGYDKHSPTYYAELDKRVDKAFPVLRRSMGAGTAPPVAPVGVGGSKVVAKGSVRLNRDDLANMRRFGLDPTNKQHLREYAVNKRSSA